MSVPVARTQIAKIVRATGDLVDVSATAEALGTDRSSAAKALARWTTQGWLRRIRRGLYAPVPLTALPEDRALDDAWRLVPVVFAPGYVGGVSAAHHWDLTEQLFRSVFVFTARPVRRRSVEIHGTPFVVRHRAESLLFGTAGVWRGASKVDVSNVHRTLVDMLDEPGAGGGIRHVADCLENYISRKDADLATVLEYAERLGNGAVFKRLGFLLERAGQSGPVVDSCASRLTKGVAKLDPAVPSPRIVSRWGLAIPDSWNGGRA